MGILVQKFGGSSVADVDKIKAVAQRVVQTREAGYDLVVVVSAMGDTTDHLLEMAKSINSTPSKRELDMLLSVGERIAMALLSMAVHAHGHKAISLTGSQCGIITTDSHSNARIMDVRPFRVQDELEKGHIVIVAGYQGTSYRREVTTLGRGGSDTTAVALAAALGAEACEIYSDVDGVFSADPRVVLDAKQLKSLTYEDMLEMARSGARVLNEEAVAFAQMSGIALYAKSTHQKNSEGTVVRPDGFGERADRAESGVPPIAVSHINEGLLVRGDSRVLDVLENQVAIFIDWTLPDQVSAFLNLENVHHLEQLKSQLAEVSADVSVSGLVSVVGDGIGGIPKCVLLAASAAKSLNVDVQTISTSRSRISLVVATSAIRELAPELHRRFTHSASETHSGSV